MADVKLTAVQKAYGDVRILHGIDLEIRDGEFMVFVGPSGCGKSTLLRSIAGLEDITGGTLAIGGRVVNDVPPAERGIAMVFQSYALYPHMDLYENMAFGLRLAKVPKAEIDAAVQGAAKILHIDHLLQRKPKDLSGGQRQRVAIAQQLMVPRSLLLMDEPFSGLDPLACGEVEALIAEVANLDEANTVILVTHDLRAAMAVSDTLYVMGRQRDERGAPKGGARVVATYDLVARGLAWRKDIEDQPAFSELARELRQLFRRL